MPRLKRLYPLVSKAVDPLVAFQWTVDGSGCDSIIGEPCFTNRREAARVWDRYRRVIWSQCHRFAIPGPAMVYDGLSFAGLEECLWHWNHVEFPLARVVAALRRDRHHLARFETTKAATQITDYLEVFRSDLEIVERAARELAAQDTPARAYPRLSTAATYGGNGSPVTPRRQTQAAAEEE